MATRTGERAQVARARLSGWARRGALVLGAGVVLGGATLALAPHASAADDPFGTKSVASVTSVVEMAASPVLEVVAARPVARVPVERVATQLARPVAAAGAVAAAVAVVPALEVIAVPLLPAAPVPNDLLTADAGSVGAGRDTALVSASAAVPLPVQLQPVEESLARAAATMAGAPALPGTAAPLGADPSAVVGASSTSAGARGPTGPDLVGLAAVALFPARRSWCLRARSGHVNLPRRTLDVPVSPA